MKSILFFIQSLIFAAAVSPIHGIEDKYDMAVEIGQCDIDVFASFGFTMGNKKPYAVFEATNIKKEGIIDFTSNCTFDRDYLSCKPEPYTLHIQDSHSHCHIQLPSMNKTILVEIEFINLDPSNPVIPPDTPLSIAIGLVWNWEVLTIAITTCIVVTTASLMFIFATIEETE